MTLLFSTALVCHIFNSFSSVFALAVGNSTRKTKENMECENTLVCKEC
ncbi:hypothetical protein HMPREF0044_1176 [Gleimia coleocanis DSM 15436]|uniref:Uncharacterized protein n=1 Tax=Gleimia coleocanis DSM 15436 TaxID=525245 RepID=C0W186_9ACTO|nr:hypothetical protein HMPREF0044_1176 [Gleimia coleocanis DSM 15436]